MTDDKKQERKEGKLIEFKRGVLFGEKRELATTTLPVTPPEIPQPRPIRKEKK